MKLFECGIRYEKTMENGMQKKVTEYYIVDALSFAEAEARITAEMTPFMGGDFAVVALKITNIAELVTDPGGLISRSDAEFQKLIKANANASGEADRWYKAKVNFITLNEKSGKERKQPTYLLIQAGSINAAHDLLVEHMKGTMADYEIANLDETKYLDVYTYATDNQTSAS